MTSEDENGFYFRGVASIALYSCFVILAICLAIRMICKFSQKWLFPHIFALTLFLSLDYLLEICNAILFLLNDENSLFVSAFSAFALHCALMLIMYSTTRSMKYMLILLKRVKYYCAIICLMGLALTFMIAYINVLFWMAYYNYDNLDKQYIVGFLQIILYFLYAGISLGNIVTKKTYERRKYQKHKIYLWTIFFFFTCYAFHPLIQMLLFYENDDNKNIFNFCSNGIADFLPLWSSFNFVRIIKSSKEALKKSQALLSFTADNQKNQKDITDHQNSIISI